MYIVYIYLQSNNTWDLSIPYHLLPAGWPNRTQVASLLQGGVVGWGLCQLYLPPRKLRYYPKRGYLKGKIAFQPEFSFGICKFSDEYSNQILVVKSPDSGQANPPKKKTLPIGDGSKRFCLLLIFVSRFLGRKILTVLDDLHSYPSCLKKWQDWISWYFGFKPRGL